MSYERIKVASLEAIETYWSKLQIAISQKLGKLYSLLEEPKQKPTHDFFCECRKCQPSINTYWRYLRKELKWNKDGHLNRR